VTTETGHVCLFRKQQGEEEQQQQRRQKAIHSAKLCKARKKQSGVNANVMVWILSVLVVMR